MAKKNTPRSGRGRQGDDRSVVSLGAHRADRALAGVSAGFMEWFAHSHGSRKDALEHLDVVKAVVTTYFGVSGSLSATAFDPDVLAILMDGIEDVDPSHADEVFDVFHLYVDFLNETGAWSGSTEDFEACHLLLSGEIMDDVPWISVPDLSEADEAAAFATLPLIQRARTLLDWLGDGRPVTGTGALRLKDVQGAAACVGVAARGRGTRPAAGKIPSPGGEASTPDPAADLLTVDSMHNVPLLGQIWNSLASSGLMRITSTRAVPCPVDTGGGDGGVPEALETWRNFIGGFLQQLLDPGAADDVWESVPVVLAVTLVAACSDDPPESEAMPGLLGAPSGSTDKYGSEARGQDDELAALAGLFWEVALDRLADLAELGLVELDSHIRVPVPLIRSVAEALQDQFDVDVEYPVGVGASPPVRPGPIPVAGPLHSAPQPGPPGAPVRTGTTPPPSSAYQLKIQLRNSKPPIWRRVVVPSGLRLDELHELIQALFGWWDDHLHAFQVGGRGGQVYGRADPDTGALADDDVDEATVSICQVMRAEGEKIEYTYDFGDDWEHIVTLEKILSLGLAGQTDGLPRCTGGRGAAPQEDSGGVFGWMEMMEAANDPQHAEHEAIREWLGLGPGERADARAFSTHDANDAISVFRAHE